MSLAFRHKYKFNVYLSYYQPLCTDIGDLRQSFRLFVEVDFHCEVVEQGTWYYIKDINALNYASVSA